MTTLIEAANALADHLNNDADFDNSNWWFDATDVAGDYYSDELTHDADPCYRCDIFVLTDGDQTIAVCFDEGAQRWDAGDCQEVKNS